MDIKVVKCSLKSILDPHVNYSNFYDCIHRSNKLFFNGYNFLRYVLLYYFNKGKEFPEINKDFINRIFKVMTLDSCGKKNKGSLVELKKLFGRFSKITGVRKINGTNLSFIRCEEVTKILTAYKNNVTLNFTKYLFQWINEMHSVPRTKRLPKEKYDKLSDDEKKELRFKNSEIKKKRKEMMKELYQVKNDIINKTLKSDKKFHKFIKNARKNIIVSGGGKTLWDDINENPFKYVKSLLIMNKKLETLKLKMYQPLPLRTELSLKYVTINSAALRDIFTCVNEKRFTDREIWNMYFNFNWKKLGMTGYTFNDQIQTNGTTVSILLIKKSDYTKKKVIHKMMSDASREAIKNPLKVSKKVKQNATKKKKELTEEEKLERKLKNAEFNYLTDYIKNEVNRKRMRTKLIEGKLVYVDPGKRSPATMLSEDMIRFEYRNRRRIRETRRNDYSRMRRNKMNQIMSNRDIKDLYNKMKDTLTKTTNLEKFSEYLKWKFKLIKCMGKERLDEVSNYMNKLKWYSYINTKRHEDKILNEIVKRFGQDTVFIIGDWSRTDHIKGISSPNMGMKRLLKRKFEVYLVDEYKTSKINSQTGEEMKHAKVEVKYKKDGEEITYEKKLYPVLTFTTSQQTMGYINRDYNATRNIRKIVRSEILDGIRPEEYQRKKSGNRKEEIPVKPLGSLRSRI